MHGVLLSLALCMQPPVGDDAHTFEALVEQADAARDEGQHADAANLHLDAFDKLPPDQQVGLIGEIALDNAIDSVNRAQAQPQGDEVRLRLAQTLAAALRAREAAALSDAADPPPQRWREVLETLEAEEAKRQAAEAHEPRAVLLTPPDEGRGDHEAAQRGARAGMASGLLLTAGGVGLIASGVATRVRVDGIADERRLQPGHGLSTPDVAAYDAALDDWQANGRLTSTVMIAGGATATVAGVALAAWSGMRLRRHKRAEFSWVPVAGPTQAGLTLRVRHR